MCSVLAVVVASPAVAEGQSATRVQETGPDSFKVDGTRVVQETFEEAQVVLFTRSGLAAGPHTLAIEVMGTRNPASTDTLIVVDAFDVTP